MHTVPRVTILLRRLVQYRVPLLNRLRKECASHGIELRVVYGQASESDAMRNDAGSLPWADEVHSRWYSIGNTELLWQPCPREPRDCDLLIMTQEIKILSNYPFLLGRLFGGRKVAYWGHGRSLQSKNPSGLRERWKTFLLTRVDWWFAYTGHTRDILVEHGFPEAKITCLYNAIDNEQFCRDLNAVPDTMLAALRREIGLAPEAPLGLYCGSLYGDKRIDLMVDAAERTHAAIPSFRLVIIGDGPARPELESRIRDREWAKWVGVLTGVDKAAWFRLAKVIVSPGAVGLHVLDAFAAGVPLFTTENALHGPEIEYLENGKNGFVLPDNPADFSAGIIALLNDPERYRAICEAGQVAAGRYTIANMTANFVEGIRKCLGR
jgi:L-malate glycosyltransferase